MSSDPPELDVDLLEPVLQRFVQAIGLANTMRLVERCAGVPTYFPRQPTPEHWLTQLIGMDAALRVAAMWGGESPVLPGALPALRELRNRQMRAARADTSIRGLARAYRLGRRRVQQILAEADADLQARQPGLFEPEP